MHGPAVYHGTFNSYLYEENTGLAQQYEDTKTKDSNQSHHYAGILYAAYFWGTGTAQAGGLWRDSNNPGDLALGDGAAEDALTIHHVGTYYGANDLSIISQLILFYKTP
jgi:hypothetical protein